MIDRYSLPEMKQLWELKTKYDTWLQVELAVVQAHAEVGNIPREAADAIARGARYDLERALELEETLRHDMLAFVGAVQENLGPEGRYFHYGVTSYDIEDPALALLTRRAIDLILADLDALCEAIRARAREHKWTVMIGRTHGVHAEPITFGFKLAVWLAEFLRGRERLLQAREMISSGKISGAVGTHAHVDPRVEALVCERLGLRPAPVSTQILQRDRHAQVICALAILSASVEKYATEIRNLQRTEIREVEEPFRKGQRGSSAMPHKRNPWVCEQLSGLARVVRGYVVPALESITTWHERDLANSSVERVILPDAFILVDYQLQTFTRIVRDLVVYPENMRANLERMGGIVYSQPVMLALVEKGVSRDEAYQITQALAMRAWEAPTASGSSSGDFRQRVRESPDVCRHLSEEELERCFDVRRHLKNLEHTFAQLGI
ncbi:MAG: adenylosuccinate lyase [Armatimonadetes bacterium]|nr:adenylosuccinate lyase [Armatimonadota bacterium]